MKKLVTACAACLVAGLVSAQIASVNIVGYQNLALPTGYKMMTSTFIPVGSDGAVLRLADIVPSNFSIFNGDTVQFFNLNGSGSVTNMVSWMGGWVDATTYADMSNLEIPAGTGMFVFSTQANVTFQMVGEVALAELPLAISSGYTVVGNSSPVAITLGNVVPTNFSIFEGDTIQFFNSNGNGGVVTMASYMGGWVDATTYADLSATVLNPGDGFFVYTTKSNTTLTFPAITVN